MRYNLTSLQIFVAVAEERNLTRAAARSHLAPSAVSKRVAELEEQAGAALFVRSARGMRLTPAGQSMLHYARQMFRTMQEMEDELHGYSAGVKGHVRIHAITSALGQFLPDDLKAFTTQYPLIRLDIEERVGAAIVRAVEDGSADLGIIASQTPAHGLQVLPYRDDELVLAVPSGHPLAARASAGLRDALEYEFIGPHLDSSLHALLSGEATALGLAMQQRIRVSSFDCMCRMIATGMGIGILPRGIVAPHLAAMPVVALPLEDAWAMRALVIVVKEFDGLPAVAKALVDQLGQPAVLCGRAEAGKRDQPAP
jgi:DNA-binding transcriptional LysR family regulator